MWEMLLSHKEEAQVSYFTLYSLYFDYNDTTLCLFWTGGTVTDLDGDGQLDLLIAHGESAQQPISVFKVTQVCWFHGGLGFTFTVVI